MSKVDLEARVAVLEKEQARLREILERKSPAPKLSLKTYAGSWADDPDLDEAMRLGREYRESLRPKKASRRKV
jgi:hypothetical protein